MPKNQLWNVDLLILVDLHWHAVAVVPYLDAVILLRCWGAAHSSAQTLGRLQGSFQGSLQADQELELKITAQGAA